MQLGIDEDKLLYIESTEDTAGKEYTHTVSGYTFISLDKEILVYHKKEIKQIRLKNLSDKMNVFYLTERGVYAPDFDQPSFLKALSLFQGYEEETDKTYYFFPKFPEKQIDEINKELQTLDIDVSLQKTEKGVCVLQELTTSDEELLSFLFALTLLYGKFDIKGDELKSLKIHIPLFGQYTKYREFFDQIVTSLQSQGIFISTSIQESSDGIVYQFSSSDWELLETFALWYKPIENIEKISKLDLTNQIKGQLEEYIEAENIENKKEILNQLENGILKILQK